jgi:hypothetical protein
MAMGTVAVVRTMGEVRVSTHPSGPFLINLAVLRCCRFVMLSRGHLCVRVAVVVVVEEQKVL